MQILPSVIRALLCFTPVWGDASVSLGSSGMRDKEVIGAQVVPRSSSSEREDASFNNRNLRCVVDDFDNHTIINGTEAQFFYDDFDNHTIINGTEDSNTIVGGTGVATGHTVQASVDFLLLKSK
jgi:hypothetical protein